MEVRSSFFFFYSILRWSVAVSIMRRQSSRIAAFLQADARPMFCWPRSASTARRQVWLGLPDGRFQSGGSPRITAATARWWSSCGEVRSAKLNIDIYSLTYLLTYLLYRTRRAEEEEQWLGGQASVRRHAATINNVVRGD